MISTHAPLAGRDFSLSGVTFVHFDFNPRAPCGARPAPKTMRETMKRFQPTRPLRGATLPKVPKPKKEIISTHAPLAGRDTFPPSRQSLRIDFNPRAPCGARQGETGHKQYDRKFQPTRPLRGATKTEKHSRGFNKISTHAPLAGRDLNKSRLQGLVINFNPRAPCGARLILANPTTGQ